MRKWTAIWIDQRQARVFIPTGAGCEVKTVLSGLERLTKSTGGRHSTRPYFHPTVINSKHEFSRRQNDVKKFFSDILELVDPSERLLIIGPGVFKEEFKSFVEERLQQLGSGVLEMSTPGYMTVPELKRWVLAHFGVRPRRWQPNTPGHPVLKSLGETPAVVH